MVPRQDRRGTSSRPRCLRRRYLAVGRGELSGFIRPATGLSWRHFPDSSMELYRRQPRSCFSLASSRSAKTPSPYQKLIGSVMVRPRSLLRLTLPWTRYSALKRRNDDLLVHPDYECVTCSTTGRSGVGIAIIASGFLALSFLTPAT